jgi:hypothetical protein
MVDREIVGRDRFGLLVRGLGVRRMGARLAPVEGPNVDEQRQNEVDGRLQEQRREVDDRRQSAAGVERDRCAGC